jgi:hypothetical protein
MQTLREENKKENDLQTLQDKFEAQRKVYKLVRNSVSEPGDVVGR